MINSLIISVFQYCAPLLVDSKNEMVSKLQTLLMKCTRMVLGFSSYKMSTIQIMSELNLITIHHLIVKETILFIHKILFNEKPEGIFRLFTYSRTNNMNIRSVRKPMLLQPPKTNNVAQSLFYRAVYLYNCLDHELKQYNPKKLSKHLQKYVGFIFPNNKVPKVS